MRPRRTWGIEGIDDLGGTLGLGAKLGHGPMFSIRVDLEDFICSAKFNSDTEESDSKLQNDLLLSAGLSFGSWAGGRRNPGSPLFHSGMRRSCRGRDVAT